MSPTASEDLVIKDPDSTVVFSRLRPTSQDVVEDDEGEFDVSLRTHGLIASATLLGGGVAEFPFWLERLAQSFRGWQGVKRWSTWDSALSMEARHDGAGHVTLLVAIAAPDGHEPDWTASARLVVDAGEDVRNLAEASKAVLSPYGAGRPGDKR